MRVVEVDGAVVYEVVVENPTSVDAEVTVCLATGTIANDAANPGGVKYHNRNCSVPANDHFLLRVGFEPKLAKFIGKSHSASIRRVKFAD